MKSAFCKILLVAAIGFSAAVARADRQPFEVTATSTANPAISVSASGSNLEDFVTNIIQSQGPFQALLGQPFIANSTFLGIPNALTFNMNAAGTSLTFTLAPINYTRTFTGATSDELDDQLEDFLQEDGAAIYAQFLKAVNEQSPVAVADGNPQAATATSANDVFVSQGLTPAEELAAAAEGGEAASQARFSGFGLGFNGGKFKAAGFEGSNADFTFTGLNFRVGENVRIVTPISLSYLKVGDAQVAGAGINVSVPWRIKAISAENPLAWRLTPSGGASLRGSVDLGSGALLWNAGLTNTLDYKINRRLVMSVVNQVTMHKSVEVSYGDYSLDPEINQQVLKNGLRAVTPLSTRVIGDFFVIQTNFLRDAAVQSFTTVGGSLALRASKSWNLNLGANYDTGTSFRAWAAGLSSAWRW